MPRLTVKFEELTGWGERIGWLDAADLKSVPGLCVNRFPVFRNINTGYVGIGMPLTLGELPASRHRVVSFNSERNHRRFVDRLLDALRAARPDFFKPGADQ